jgi:hypothetical protein
MLGAARAMKSGSIPRHDRRHPDRGRDGDGASAEIERGAGDAAGQPLGGLDRAIVVEMVEDQPELVVADAREQVGRAGQAREHLGGVDQRRVGREAPVAALDPGEAGDPLQLAQEAAAIGERRDRVAIIMLLELVEAAGCQGVVRSGSGADRHCELGLRKAVMTAPAAPYFNLVASQRALETLAIAA